ncbi:MAG: ABC transporter permease [Planctomycetota bacterium]
MSAPTRSLRSSATGRVLLHLLGRRGAQVGGVWIATLVLLSIFAPLLASSHPLLWSRGGAVSSPWLEHLTATDAVLLLSFGVAAVLLCWRPLRWGRRVSAWLWCTASLTAAAGLRAVLSQWDAAEPGALPLPVVLTGSVLLASVGVLVVLPLSSSAGARFWGVVFAAGLLLGGGFFALDVDPPSNVVFSSYREAAAAGEVDWQVTAPLPFSPADYQRDRMSATGEDARYLPPSLAHPFGTEQSGADVLSRMIHASRIALAIGLIATGIAAALGVVVGALMGYFAGWIDLIGMRLVEVFSAIPVIFLLIMVVAFYGRNLYLMMVIIGLTGWVGYAVFVRAEFLKLRKMDFVQAAHACGTPLWSVLMRHMLPNGVTPVLVLASFGIASAILVESTLSFLGLGLVEEPSWGQLLNQSRDAPGQWGLLIFPGLAIFLTVFAYNLVGEALRDALDPRVAGAD